MKYAPNANVPSVLVCLKGTQCNASDQRGDLYDPEKGSAVSDAPTTGSRKADRETAEEEA